jgi:hypothetical protein
VRQIAVFLWLTGVGGYSVNAHWKTYFFEHRPDLQKLIIIIAAGGLSA